MQAPPFNNVAAYVVYYYDGLAWGHHNRVDFGTAATRIRNMKRAHTGGDDGRRRASAKAQRGVQGQIQQKKRILRVTSDHHTHERVRRLLAFAEAPLSGCAFRY